jgi:hypothetical protein
MQNPASQHKCPLLDISLHRRLTLRTQGEIEMPLSEMTNAELSQVGNFNKITKTMGKGFKEDMHPD